MSTKNLIFLTSEFPFGQGETFIENEFPFLLKSFDKIIILTNGEIKGESRLGQNRKVEVMHYSYQLTFVGKLRALKGVFSKMFWQEIAIINNKYKLKISRAVFNTLLSSIQKSKHIADTLEHVIANKKLNAIDTIVYSYWLNDMAIGAAELKIRMPEIKSISRAHGWDVYMDRQPSTYLPLRTFVLNNLDACFAISENGQHYLQSQFNVKSRKIKMSQLGTLPHTLIYPLSDKTDSSVFTIVSCSSIIPLKRIHLLVEALSFIREHPIRWVHFGDGSQEAEIKQMAHDKLSHFTNIEIEFKGRVGNKKVLDYYITHKVNLFVNVSETEGVPVSIMEAMSFAIPCIATNVGGNSEIVNTENGTLLTPDPSVQEISEVLMKFLNMKAFQYADYSQQAYNTWKNKYNAEVNYPDFIKQVLR